MSEEAIPALRADLASALFDSFVVRRDAYALQMPNGAYKTIKQPLTRLRIRQMLRDGESLLSYQFEGTMTRWLCLDFDVPKKTLQEPSTPEARLAQITSLFRRVEETSDHLTKQGIDHLIEFSGNRGFHIWFLFEDKLSRANGHAVLTKTFASINSLQTSKDVIVDLFPSNPSSTAEFGHGVKLPLSIHKKSECYSYFIDRNKPFIINDTIWVRDATANFLLEQLGILRNCLKQNLDYVAAAVGVPVASQTAKETRPKFIRTSLKLVSDSIQLVAVQEQLSRCSIIHELFERAATGEKLNEKERLPLVGLLVRLRGPNDPHLGLRLATEYFASLSGFDPDVTRAKLSELRLFPPTCALLKTMFPQTPCDCGGETKVSSPLHFLTDTAEEYDAFHISDEEASSIVLAQISYTRMNDEIALVPTLAELGAIDTTSAALLCNNRNTNRWPPVEFASFLRVEEENKERTLATLAARDKIWSTAAIRQIHRIFSFDFSPHSYGYRIQHDMAGHQIFQPWLNQWKAFTGRLSRYIFPPHCDAYYLIKIDIKSFYPSIDQDKLLVKLSDGPTSSLATFINSLAPEQVQRYRSICKELVSLCRRVQGTRKGVPQGPAFARYLAEVFLMDFDQQISDLLEDGVICYARYVDDIFIVVDPDSDHRAIERKAITALNRLGLDLNPSKHFSGRVVDYRAVFARYRQDTKYLVDQVSRRFRSSSNDEIRNATEKLRMLVEGEFGDGPHNEHLNFLYTHLDEDPGTKHLRRKYEMHVLKLIEGRGSFFSNFFGSYLQSPNRISDDVKVLQNLNGLRRQVFINTLLKRTADGKVDTLERPVIKRIFEHYLPTANSIEQELMAHCSLIEPEVCPEGLLERMSKSLIKLLSCPLPKRIPTSLVGKLEEALLELPISEFIVRCHEVIYNNTIDSNDLITFGSLFINRIVNSLHEKSPENYRLPFLSTPDLRGENITAKHYQMCCLVSCIKPEHTYAEQEALWKSMVYSYNEIASVDLGYPVWISKINDDVVSFSNVNIILVASVEDGFFPGESDQHDAFQTYLEYLTLCTLLPEAERTDLQRTKPADSRFEELRSRLRDEKAPFLKWILQDPPAEFYPNRLECLENIIRNDLMVLKRGSELLIRIRSELSEEPDFTYLGQTEKFDEGFMRARYRTIKYNFISDGLDVVLDRLLDSSGLTGFLKTILEIRQEAENFSSHFGLANRFFNILAGDARSFRKTRFPLVPYTVHGNFLISSSHGTAISRPNTSLGLLEGLQDLVRTCGLSVLDFSHECNLTGSQLVELLSVFSSVQEQWIFLRNLSDFFHLVENMGLHDIEHCKAAALLAALRERPQPSETRLGSIPPLTHVFLRLYLSTRDRPDAHLLLLFDAHAVPSRSTLHSLYASLSGSIAQFRAAFGYSLPNFDLDVLLTRELRSIMAAAQARVGNSQTLSADDFTECTVEIRVDTGEAWVNDELVVSRNDDGLEGVDVYACFLSNQDFSFQRIGEHFNGSASNGKLLAYQCIIPGRRLLVIAGGALSAAFDRVQTRHIQFMNLSKGQKYQIRKAFYENSRLVEISILELSRFKEALRVVREHRGCPEPEARARLLRWLLCFPTDLHPMLVRVIAAHEVVGSEDRANFIRHLKSAVGAESVFCSIKRLMDVNGTHRLIMADAAGSSMMRDMKFDSFVENIIKSGRTGRKVTHLIFVADVSISGSQMRRALAYYFSPSGFDRTLAEGQLWHSIPASDEGDFIKGIRSVTKVSFVFGLYTKQAKETLTRVCVDALGISSSAVLFHGRAMDRGKSCVKGNPDITVDMQQQFSDLVADVDFLEGIFAIPSRKRYKQSISRMDEHSLNTVARFNSMPKGGAMLFWLPPHDPGVEPLFNRIEEHSRD